jgi:hypothetical protein
MALLNFSLISHCVIDSMHCLWEGVVFQFFHLWFDSSNHEKKWYIGSPGVIKQIATKLNNIQVSFDIARHPGKFDTAAHWKAIDWKN